jgi:uncharacterized membrane protein
MEPATKIIPSYLRVAVVLTLVNLAILGIRNLYVGEHFFNFLESNLFIGSFPTIIIAWLIDMYHEKMGKFLFWFAVALWVLFYPNAPYMISDLIHNSEGPKDDPQSELIIYDTLIIFSFAMLSVFIGFLSLKVIFRIFIEKYGKRFARAFITFTLILSCLGFYMGRELPSAIKHLGNGKLYSWEIFLEPIQIIKITWHSLWPIQDNIPVYLLMMLFGVVQYMLLIMFKDVNDVEDITHIT